MRTAYGKATRNSSVLPRSSRRWRPVTEVIEVRRLTIAVDAGLVINHDGAEEQVGGPIQAYKGTEGTGAFRRITVTATKGESFRYRFSEVPAVGGGAIAGHENPPMGSEKPRKTHARPSPTPLCRRPPVSACAR